MKKSVLLLLPLFLVCAIAGLSNARSNESKSLSLSPAEMKSVCRAAGLKERGGRYFVRACDKEIPAKIELVDLNGDGRPEVLVTASDAYCFGVAGSGFSLLIKNREGRWKKDFDLRAGFFTALKTKHRGYFDIEVGGPGFSFPVYRWNGEKYVFYRTERQSQ